MGKGWHATTEENLSEIQEKGLLPLSKRSGKCEQVWGGDIKDESYFSFHSKEVKDIVNDYRCNGVYFFSGTGGMEGLAIAGKQAIEGVEHAWLKDKKNVKPAIVSVERIPNDARLDPESHAIFYEPVNGDLGKARLLCRELENRDHYSYVYKGSVKPEAIDCICTFEDEYFEKVPKGEGLGEFLGKTALGKDRHDNLDLYDTFYDSNYILSNINCECK